MELAKSFEPHAIEAKWYPIWESRGYFKPSTASPARRPYCIQLPPPNVTGTLHMGHAFQQTLMDVLDPLPPDARRQHAVAGRHRPRRHRDADRRRAAARRREGKSRHDLGREQFVERVWAWKEESGSTITRQMRRLGTSADWSRERFTMDEGLSAAVLETFVRLLRGRPHLPRQAPRQLGPEARHRGVGPRGRQRGGAGQALGDPLSARRRHGDRWSSRRRGRRRCWATSRSR